MISVQEAKNIIQSNARLLPPVTIPLTEAFGLVLAEDVYAQVSIPHFHQSAMDGYALRYEDYAQAKELTISGEVAAGVPPTIALAPGQAVRIFTGAVVPEGADTVVMQEKTEVTGNKLIIRDDGLRQWSNVRMEGSEITKGAPALVRGTVLSPAAIGFLAGTGTTEVTVYPKPKIHIIITGKELQKPGRPLSLGQVYESNSFMLQSALNQLHLTDVRIDFVDDDLEQIQATLTHAVAQADLILLTGGVSVGNYDLVTKAADACGIQQLLHKVKQRPGKPLYAGRKENKLIFGLPGNPSSVLVCFYVYVTAAIEELTGRKDIIRKRYVPLAVPYHKKHNLTQFLKAVCTHEEVAPLHAQESFRLSSFSVADSLIVLPEETTEVARGELVETLILPYS